MSDAARLHAVVFDFDGTLARPALDFALMKERLALLAGRFAGYTPVSAAMPALEWIDTVAASLAPTAAGQFRAQCMALVEDMEREAARRTSLFGFTRPVLEGLARRGVATAVITRNTRQAVDAVFPDAGEYLAVVLAREDVARVKPDPAHLLAALRLLGAHAGNALMVGDHPLDVLTARRAGTWAAAVASGDTPTQDLERCGPDFLAGDAAALFAMLADAGHL